MMDNLKDIKNGVSIFTPSYNRAYTLPALYESLKRQTNKNFEWIVVDDGSTDGTKELIKGFIQEGKLYIKYYYQDNSGKHVAHNLGVKKAEGALFTCVDSDDFLVDDAVEEIRKTAREAEGCIGMLFAKGNIEHKSLTNWNYKVRTATLYDAYKKYGLVGDTMLVYRTEIIKKESFPQYKEEKFIPESYLYDRLDQYGPLLITDKILYICEYLPDGYTASMRKVNCRSPHGYEAYIKQRLEIDKTFRTRIEDTVRYIAIKLVIRDRKVLKDAIYPFYTIVLYFFGWIFYKMSYEKYMKKEEQKTNKKRILLLSYNNDNNENCLMDAVNESQSVETRCVFPYVSLFFRTIRRIMLIYKIPGIGIWLGEWKKRLEDYKVVIIIASQYTPVILHWIHKRYPEIRLINYYWDKIEIAQYPIEYSSYFENWSFDKMDSQKYGFKYNPQYYSSKLKLINERVEYDITFVGADRGGKWTSRTELVNKYYDELKNTDFKLFFYYVSCDEKSCREITHDTRLSEAEYLRVVAKSKAVFDIIEPEKEWMTLRPLLALANRKKVITNYSQIANEAFYTNDNVFIITGDRLDIEALKKFIDRPFVELRANILKEYEVETWAHRFEK